VFSLRRDFVKAGDVRDGVAFVSAFVSALDSSRSATRG